MPVYQVWVCTTVASAAALAITRSVDSVDSAGLAPRSCAVGLVRERARPRRAHAVHVDLAQLAQLRDELGDVYPGAAVDLRRIFPSHHRHSHTRHRSSRYRTCAPATVLPQHPNLLMDSPSAWVLRRLTWQGFAAADRFDP